MPKTRVNGRLVTNWMSIIYKVVKQKVLNCTSKGR